MVYGEINLASGSEIPRSCKATLPANQRQGSCDGTCCSALRAGETFGAIDSGQASRRAAGAKQRRSTPTNVASQPENVGVGIPSKLRPQSAFAVRDEGPAVIQLYICPLQQLVKLSWSSYRAHSTATGRAFYKGVGCMSKR